MRKKSMAVNRGEAAGAKDDPTRAAEFSLDACIPAGKQTAALGKAR